MELLYAFRRFPQDESQHVVMFIAFSGIEILAIYQGFNSQDQHVTRLRIWVLHLSTGSLMGLLTTTYFFFFANYSLTET